MKRLAILALVTSVPSVLACDAETALSRQAAGAIATPNFAISDYFTPSGFMGDGELPGFVNMFASERCKEPRPAGALGRCYHFDYGPPGRAFWAGAFWSYPSNNWGVEPGRAFSPWVHDMDLAAALGRTGDDAFRTIRQRYNRIRFTASARRDGFDFNFRSWRTATGQDCEEARRQPGMEMVPCTCHTLVNAGVQLTGGGLDLRAQIATSTDAMGREVITLTDSRVSPDGTPLVTTVRAAGTQCLDAPAKFVVPPGTYQVTAYQPDGLMSMTVRSWDGMGVEADTTVTEAVLPGAAANVEVSELATTTSDLALTGMTSGATYGFPAGPALLDVVFFSAGATNAALTALTCPTEICKNNDNVIAGATPRQLVTRLPRQPIRLAIPMPDNYATAVYDSTIRGNPFATRADRLRINTEPCVVNAAGVAPTRDDLTESVLCPPGTLVQDAATGRPIVATCSPGLLGQMAPDGSIVCCEERLPQLNAMTGALDCGSKQEIDDGGNLISTPNSVYVGYWSLITELTGNIVGAFGWSHGYTEFELPPINGMNTMMQSVPNVPQFQLFLDDIVWEYVPTLSTPLPAL